MADAGREAFSMSMYTPASQAKAEDDAEDTSDDDDDDNDGDDDDDEAEKDVPHDDGHTTKQTKQKPPSKRQQAEAAVAATVVALGVAGRDVTKEQVPRDLLQGPCSTCGTQGVSLRILVNGTVNFCEWLIEGLSNAKNFQRYRVVVAYVAVRHDWKY